MNVTLQEVDPSKSYHARINFHLFVGGFLWSLIMIAIYFGVIRFLVFLTGSSKYMLITIVITIVVTSFINSKTYHIFRKDFAKSKDFIGNVNISEMGILTSKEKIETTDIKNLYVHHNYILGRNYSVRDIKHNGIITFDVTLKNTEKKLVKAQIVSKKQLNELSSILLSYHKSGIQIKEEFGTYNTESLLFEVNPSYEKIQEIKKLKPTHNNGYK